MAYCKNCGMPIDEKKEIRCSRCGEFTDDSGKSGKKDTYKTLVIALVCVIVTLSLLCVAVIFIGSKNTDEPESVQQDNATTIIVQNNAQQSVNVEINNGGNKNTAVYNQSYNTTNIPPVFSSQSSYSFVAGSGGYISYDTPGHAGVNLRKYNDAGSVVLVTLPEGTWVTAAETTTVYGDGYVKVSVTYNGKSYSGYVLAKYIFGVGGLADDGKGDDEDYGSYDDYDDMSDLYVSYNTPDHLGLNVRREASSKSEILVTLPEGTSLAVVDLENADDYCYIETYYNGNCYRGYILTKYIDS